MIEKIRIATRKSELALWQANHVAGLLRDRYPGLTVELLPMVTKGDIILDQPLAEIGGKGLFLKELERALIKGNADIAVHSMKDVPVEQVPGLTVDVMLERANPFDALLSRDGVRLAALEAGSRVGTSSLRRQCQLRATRPDLAVMDLRGNVNTRIRKLQEGEYAAIILACAGLERLGMDSLITETLEPPNWLPAATQGTIGIQCRDDDRAVIDLIEPLKDRDAVIRTRAERAVATALHGSCQVPLAVYADLHEGQIRISSLVGMPDGSDIIRADLSGEVAEVDRLSAEVADELLGQGAARIIASLG
ncbi:MAG: hydroxymethylbilane synthase [Xanthomonadales bacterium]|nr:hydroxymethylbilane synthase [Gammaproteobacteria bacterium]MBT8054837.1 hydroxymethylbilane synthase [Gammaproteobacteria bacterium]NND58518.1 hydroxymethylbilane synthase [Xanthomonadales bacterium]NNK51102.1 hydroxymethylbilane synthase [Xanthomonadales bacterium]